MRTYSEFLDIDPVIDNYIGDIQRAAQLHALAQQIDAEFRIDNDPNREYVAIPIDYTNGKECQLRRNSGVYQIVQFGLDPLPLDLTSRKLSWVPKIEFSIVASTGLIERPTSFEVEDKITRRAKTLHQPEPTVGPLDLLVPSDHVLARFVDVVRPPANTVAHSTRLGSPSFDLNRNRPNVYRTTRIVDPESEAKLLTSLQAIVASPQVQQTDTQPYIREVEVELVDITERQHFQKFASSHIICQVGSIGLVQDKAPLLYKKVRELDTGAITVIRELDDTQKVAAFVILQA